MQGIVLCGGPGAKMWPYNKHWQKCCLPVGNLPNVLRIVRQLRQAGISPITLVAGHMQTQLRYLLRNEKAVTIVNGAPGDMIAELGRAGPALVYYGDVYMEDSDLAGLLTAYMTKGSCALLCAAGGAANAQDHICAKEETGVVQGFWGHPRPHYVNAKAGGVYALDQSLLAYAGYSPGTFLQVPVGGMPPEGFFLEQCLQTALEDGHAIRGVYAKGPYVDMDLPWDYMTANQLYCRHTAGALQKTELERGAFVSDGATVRGHLLLGAGSHIGERVVIEGNCIVGDNTIIENGAIIGPNCVIGSHTILRDYCRVAEETVVGSYNKIGFSAEISGVTLDRVAIVHSSEVFGVVGRGTDIAAGCVMGIIRFDDADSVQKAPKRKYSGKNVNGIFIGDHCRTGIGNLFAPGVKIGANSCIGPGVIIEKDLPENRLLLLKQDLVETDWGPDRYGW